MAGPEDDPGRLWLLGSQLPIVQPPLDADVLAWDLGAGESEVLSYAHQNEGRAAVLDDRAARRCAHALEVPCVGTLGIILRAKRQGVIPAAVPLLKSLQATGFRLDAAVLRPALLAVANEEWE